MTLGLVLGSGAAAQSPADAVVQQLRDQGYVSFEVSRTLLGRVRVVALTSDGGRREIVFSPASGEILRDYFEAADGTVAPRVLDRPDDGGLPSTTGEQDNDDRSARQGDDPPPREAGQGSSPSPRQDRDDGSDADDDRPRQRDSDDEDEDDDDRPRQRDSDDEDEDDDDRPRQRDSDDDDDRDENDSDDDESDDDD